MTPTTPIPVNLAELLAPYKKGEWVTLSHDEKRVLGASTDIDEAIRQAKSQGEDRPILIKSPEKNAAFLL
jgi:hypothetical protein